MPDFRVLNVELLCRTLPEPRPFRPDRPEARLRRTCLHTRRPGRSCLRRSNLSLCRRGRSNLLSRAVERQASKSASKAANDPQGRRAEAPRSRIRLVSWSEVLPRTSGRETELRQRLADTRRRVESALLSVAADVELALLEHWTLPEEKTVGLELVLVERREGADGEPQECRHRLTLHRPAILIGSDPRCHLQLLGSEIPRRAVELQVDSQSVTLRVLDDSAGRCPVELRGEPVAVGSVVALATGDHLAIDDYSVAIGLRQVVPTERDCRIELLEPLDFASASEALGSQGADRYWFRVAAAGWSGFVALDQNWLHGAHRQAGLLTGESGAVDLDVASADLASELTTSVLGRLAATAGRRLGYAVSTSSVVPPTRLSHLSPETFGATNRVALEGARLRLTIGSEVQEVLVLWPRNERERASAAQVPSWIGSSRVPVSVEVGEVALRLSEVEHLQRGDVLLPDDWWPERPSGVDDADLAPCSRLEGEVRLVVANAARPARLVARQPSGENMPPSSNPAFELSLELNGADWRLFAHGGFDMKDSLDTDFEKHDPPNLSEARHASDEDTDSMPAVRRPETEPESIDLASELELVVAFEVDRLSVPLAELTQWNEGATIRLGKRPDDSIRILLRQGRGSRLLGNGRVVVIDGQLGVQIERWLGDPLETMNPGARAASEAGTQGQS